MKKLLTLIAVLSVLMNHILEPSVAYAGEYDSEHLYGSLMVVYEIDYRKNIVTVQDVNGDLWLFHGTEDWSVGDFLVCVMFDNWTEEVYDDLILSTTYTRPDLLR